MRDLREVGEEEEEKGIDKVEEDEPFLRAFCFSSFRCWAAGFWARSLSLAMMEDGETVYGDRLESVSRAW